GSSWELFTGKNSQIGNRRPYLQQLLYTRSIVNPCFSLLPPSLITLKIQTNTTKCHARFSIQPWIMYVNMIDQPIYAKGVISILQCFEISGMLIPLHPYLGKSLGLHKGFTIDMSAGYCIEHIVELVVRRTP